ncbi:MAG: tRNA uridine-5-carboxymethylaminomethyl(34) synthesis enzyme MnmG [Candidatus Zixiibacteriota bacterium]
MPDFDVIIVGGGHAGVEAALAVARMGGTAAIVTMDSTRLALMSCNPAIGGLGKSHLVKEIDALGGIMAEATDATGIQFRRLNLSRGPAVWATRVQCDRRFYNDYIVQIVENTKGVTVIEGIAGAILIESGRAVGIRTDDGTAITSHAVVIATGTFLGGLIHIGEKKIKSGRIGESAAYSMSESLLSFGFEVGRLKTGTPPRLKGSTIDFSVCEVQPGDNPIPFFSSNSNREPFAQAPCHLTYTTEKTKEIISANFERSPMFSGQIHSRGPRYCPSIEDKFYRFADKPSHQIFLEPEGNGTDEIYPNGFSTSLPEDIQLAAMRTVTGLEQVEFTRPGYAVEYDYCPAYQIKPSLETRRVSALFFAGQINGTSGYEEAAGQGLMAGINAMLYIKREEPFVLDRSEAYVGVMIDDLTTRSTTEPYRLFTSRAEYRLALREDNARDRLYEKAVRYGLIDKGRHESFTVLSDETDHLVRSFAKKRLNAEEISKLTVSDDLRPRVIGMTIDRLLTQPEVTVSAAVPLLAGLDGNGSHSLEALERAAIAIRYRGYVAKQSREIEKFKRLEHESIPDSFSFEAIRGLKIEALEKLSRFRPASLGQAGRIEGVTAGDIAVLSFYLKKHKEGARQ